MWKLWKTFCGVSECYFLVSRLFFATLYYILYADFYCEYSIKNSPIKVFGYSRIFPWEKWERSEKFSNPRFFRLFDNLQKKRNLNTQKFSTGKVIRNSVEKLARIRPFSAIYVTEWSFFVVENFSVIFIFPGWNKLSTSFSTGCSKLTFVNKWAKSVSKTAKFGIHSGI